MDKTRNMATQKRLIRTLKIVGYTVLSLFIWSTSAVILAVIGLVIAALIVDQNNFTSRDANNIILAIVILIASIFFSIAWLLRRYRLLFIRTSRIVLLVCTSLGVLIGVPTSIIGVWEPEPNSSLNTQQTLEQDSITPINPQLNQGDTTNGDEINKSSSAPHPATGNQVPSNSSRESSEQQAAGCKYYSDIPYETEEKPDSNMKEGQTREVGGYNGNRKECTDSNGRIVSNEITSTPTNKIKYYGTFTYEQAQAKAKSICNTSLPAGTPRNSTFYWDCVDRELKKIW